jgi:hypothetical protein
VLCDVHYQPMELVAYPYKNAPWDGSQEFFRCREAGCTRHFTRTHGYLDVRDGLADMNSRRGTLCPNHPEEHQFSSAVVGLKEGAPVWKCIYEDCTPELPSAGVGRASFAAPCANTFLKVRP